MKLLFRYDDYSEISDAGTDLAVLEALAEHGFPPLLGVIPAIADLNWALGPSIPLRRLSPERIRLLRRFASAELEIALHGYTHQTVTRFSGLFEFGDVVDLDRQAERIRDGKMLLEDGLGAPVQWFVPPWNVYGATTLEALRRCGVKGVSAAAGFGPVAGDFVFAPQTCLLNKLEAALACARRDPEAAVVVMLHDYDFDLNGDGKGGISLERFKRLLQRAVEAGARPGSFAELLGRSDWNASRALANQRLCQQAGGRLRFFLHPGTCHVYWGEPAAKRKLAELERMGRVLNGVSGLKRRLLGRG